MKSILMIGVALFLFLAAIGSASAKQENMSNNPNTVANFPDGKHTIIMPDGSIVYDQVGSDVVFKSGDNFQQFFNGVDGMRVHTLFNNVGADTQCNGNKILLVNPYQPSNGDTWGFYFNPGDNYCVHSNIQ